jgi:hypothetical protein
MLSESNAYSHLLTSETAIMLLNEFLFATSLSDLVEDQLSVNHGKDN